MEEEFQFVRGHLIDNLSVMEYHRRTLGTIEKFNVQIDELTEGVKRVPRNPREELERLHDVKTLSVIKRQRDRLLQKLNELQERIKEDIEASKAVTPLKPLK